MANVKEDKIWEEGIYQLEVTDPVVGGIDGISNKQAKQLANRTGYLREQIENDKNSVNTALAKKRDVVDSYSKTEVDKKFTDTVKTIKEELIGHGQSWQNLIAQRQAGVTYTNTTGRPIMVCIVSHCEPGGSSNLIIDGFGLCITGGGAAMQSSATGIVPNGSIYKFESAVGNTSLDSWLELR